MRSDSEYSGVAHTGLLVVSRKRSNAAIAMGQSATDLFIGEQYAIQLFTAIGNDGT